MKLYKKLQSKIEKSKNKETTTYTIKSGDNLWDISIKLGVAHKDLIEANPSIVNPNCVYPGQVINVP
jgi:nucleoid-associated protein YgaU